MLSDKYWVTIARRQFASLRNEKTIVFAIIVQLIIASFSSFLVVGIVSLYEPSGAKSEQIISVALTGNASGELSSELTANSGLSYTRTENYSEAYSLFKQNGVDGILEAKKTENNRIRTTITAPETGLKSTLTVVRTKQMLEEFERQKRFDLTISNTQLSPLRLSEDSRASPYLSFTYIVLVPILIILPAFISGSIVIDTVIEDRKTGMIEILRTSPASDTDIIRGKLLVPIIISPLQSCVWFVLISFNGTILFHPMLLILISVAFTLITVSVGVSIVGLSNNRGEAQFLYSLVLVTILSAASTLPESPNTTIAKLGMGSSVELTYILSAVYVIFGLILYTVSVRQFSLD
jgi:ABC-type Na+ efflux pump permease subunit